MDMSPQRWSETQDYLAEVFSGVPGEGARTARLAGLRERALAAGLPDISVSPDVGRLLTFLTRTVSDDPRATGRIIEIGTLGGYSGIHLASGLSKGGKLTTIEANEKHAAFARGEFQAAGVADRVEIVLSKALDVLPGLSKSLGGASLDLAFIDAVKSEYAQYLELLAPMLRPGGLLVVDNMLGAGWWITEPGTHPDRDDMDRFNRSLAKDPRFDVAGIASGHGVLVARKR